METFYLGLPQQWDDSHSCANPPDSWLCNVSWGIMEQEEVDTYSTFNLSLILCQQMIKAAAFIYGLLIYSFLYHLTTQFSLLLSWTFESIYKIMISVNNSGLIFYFPILIPFILFSYFIVLDMLPRLCREPTFQCRRHKRHRFDPWVKRITWRRAWQATPVFLPGESHEKRSMVGYSS